MASEPVYPHQQEEELLLDLSVRQYWVIHSAKGSTAQGVIRRNLSRVQETGAVGDFLWLSQERHRRLEQLSQQDWP